MQDHRRLGHDGSIGWDGSFWREDIGVAIEGTNCEDMCQDTCQYPSDGTCDDGGPGSEYSQCQLGTDCADCGARLPEANDCYFEKPSSEYKSFKSFRAGNCYKLRMTFNSGPKSWDDDDGWWDDDGGNPNEPKNVEIKFWEHDPWYDPTGDDWCLTYTLRSVSTDTHEVFLCMPHLNSGLCRWQPTKAIAERSFHEYKIEVVTTRGNHHGYSEVFRLLYEKEEYTELVSFPSPGNRHSKWEWTRGNGDTSLGLRVQCMDCHMSIGAEVHVLVRTTDYNPFEETWSWGKLGLEANLQIEAEAWLAWTPSPAEQTLVPEVCALCVSLGLAGTGVETGLKFQLEGIATAGFDARAKFTYARKRTAEGVIAMHTIGDSTFKTDMGGFDFQDSNQDDTTPATLDISVKAHASVTLRPIFTLGLWADVNVLGLTIDAEFYFKMWADLEARDAPYYQA